MTRLLSQFSIMTRLIVLSTILLSVPVATHLYLSSKIEDDSSTLANQERVVIALRKGHAASRHFGNLKFWLADLSASHLIRSETNAEASREAFLVRLTDMERLARGEVIAMRKDLAELWSHAMAAIDAHAAGRRVVGNSLMAMANLRIESIDRVLTLLVADLEDTAVLDAKTARLNSAVTVNISTAFVVIASIFWLACTILVLRSITSPLRDLVDAMHEITGGNLDVEIPQPGRDEIGVMTKTLSLLRENLVERVRLEAETKRAEEEAKQARLVAERANQAKTDFLANMTHELRTPLNAVIGFAEVMQKQSFGPLGSDVYEEYVSDMLDCANHLLSLINDVLDLSKIEAGKFVLRDQKVLMPPLVEAAMKVVRHRSEKANLELAVHCPSDLPPIWGDERALKQVLFNLLSNAVQFSKPGGRIVVQAFINAAGEFELSVADSGIGIPKDQIETVLKPFEQLDSSFSRAHTGTGLGLPLANSLVKFHDGTLEIESELDKGTKVTVRLPAERTLRDGMAPPQRQSDTEDRAEAATISGDAAAE